MVLWYELFALLAQSLVTVLWKNLVGMGEENGLRLGAGTGKMVVKVPGTMEEFNDV